MFKDCVSWGGLHGAYPNRSYMSGRWVNVSLAGCNLFRDVAGRTLRAENSVRSGDDSNAGGFAHGHITLA